MARLLQCNTASANDRRAWRAAHARCSIFPQDLNAQGFGSLPESAGGNPPLTRQSKSSMASEMSAR